MNDGEKYFEKLKKILSPYHVQLKVKKHQAEFIHGDKSLRLELPADLAWHKSPQLVTVILSRLSLNKKIFARNCVVKRVGKKEAEGFINSYHIMGSTSSAWNYGLFHKDELVAVASFSKGRKMNRLPLELRSFELIRFCTKTGITVTGGLSKLLKHFCRERNAGDIMTYIDKQFSDGSSFKKAGFIAIGETPEQQFLVNRKTLKRSPLKNGGPDTRSGESDIVSNKGNIKMILSCL